MTRQPSGRRPANNVPPPTALSIAGSDSGGSAGMHADLRTFQACGVHGTTAVTAVTVQNTLGVTDVVPVPPETVAAQIDAVAADIGVGAAKTGMLASAATIHAVAGACDAHGIGRGHGTPLVVDPVAASRHGEPILRPDALAALRDEALPRATLATPNLDEVRLLTGIAVHTRDQLLDAAKALYELGPEWVLIKGGHLADSAATECVDLLYDGENAVALPGPRYSTVHTHGAGDVFGAAITAALAKGTSVLEAVRYGKRFVTYAVQHAYPLGGGVGPVSTLWRTSPRSV